jgi:peptidoglycan/LPS O-acetylase OafA/YrhL
MQSLEEKTGGDGAASERKAGRIEFLDFARGFAILTIVLYHYSIQLASGSGFWGKAVMAGGTGVHLFIIMSGFAVCLSISTFSIPGFFKRRFARVLLPYYLFVTFVFLLNIFAKLYPENGVYAWLGHVFWFKMFDGSIIESFGGQMWFLSLIIALYVVFPILYYARKRLNNNALFAGLALLVSACYWLITVHFNAQESLVWKRFFPQYLWEFCIAMVLADMLRKKGYRFWEQKAAALAALAAGGLGLMALLALRGGSIGRAFNDIPAAVGYTSLSALAYMGFKRFVAPVVGFFKYLGGISYELFLLHVFVAAVFLRVLAGDRPRAAAYALAIPAAIVAAHFYRIFCGMLFRLVNPGGAGREPRPG